jgi:hypothetical protein
MSQSRWYLRSAHGQRHLGWGQEEAERQQEKEKEEKEEAQEISRLALAGQSFISMEKNCC